MIAWLSVKLADALVGGGAVKEEDRDIYIYGMDVLLSTAANIICILVIGILAGYAMETLLYLLFFTVLRSFAGGFHANTHFKCFLIMLSTFCISMALIYFLPPDACRWVALPIAAASVTVVAFLAPAPHENRPVSGSELVKFRRSSLLLAAAEASAVLLCLVLNAVHLALAGALGMLTSAGSLCAVYFAGAVKRRAVHDEAR